MLFRNDEHSSQFYLVGLEAAERAEIENLIKENGGEISTVRKLPAVSFGNEGSVHTPTDLPLFHVNFIRECAKQKKVMNLIDFMIGPCGCTKCLQCMVMRIKYFCPSHSSLSSDRLPTLTSTQVENGSDVDQPDDPCGTLTEHSYAHADSVDTQKPNKSAEKQPCDAEQVTEMLNCSPSESQFLPLESPPDEEFMTVESLQTADFMVPESTQGSEFCLVETPRDSEFLPDESQPDGEFRHVPESIDESTNMANETRGDGDIPTEQTPEEANLVLDMESSSDDSSMSVVPSTPGKDDSFEMNRGFVPIKIPFLTKPNFVQENIEVPEAARFEELPCDQEAEIGVASSSTEIVAEPGTSSGVGTKEALARIADFPLDSDDTDYEPDLSRRGVLRKKKRLSSSVEVELEEKDDAQRLEVIDLTAEDDDLIETSMEEEKTAKATERKTNKSQKLHRAADLDVTRDDDAPIEASREKLKRRKTKESKKPQTKTADLDLSADDDEPIEAPIEKKKPRKAEKWKKLPTKADSELSADDDEPIEAPIEQKKSRNADKWKKLPIKVADLDESGDDDEPREKKKRQKAKKKEKLPTKAADLDHSTDDDEPREEKKRQKADKSKKPQTKAADLDQQPSTSGMGKSKTTNDGRSTAVSSTRSGDAINTEDSDTSFDEGEDPDLAQAVYSRKKKTNGTKNSQSTKRTEKYPKPTRNFLPWEQRLMVKYLVDNDYISDARGLKVWRQMIDDGFLVHRTPQSLNNHFRKVILPTIHRFQMDQRSLKKFQRLKPS